MIVYKIATFFLLAVIVGAEKKIELQDIEEDNLKSEKENDYDKSEPRSQSAGSGTAPGSATLDFLKNGFLRYFENPPQAPQQTRYVQQYAVTEPPERPSGDTHPSKAKYGHSAPQQAMVGYLSNVPMQIYLVPQHYNEVSGQGGYQHQQPGLQYSAHGVSRVAAYQTSPEPVQTQTNYLEVPAYVAPTPKTYIPQYSSPVAYVSYTAQPTVAPPQPTIAPVLAYQMPVVHYPAPIATASNSPKSYYQHTNTQYADTNAIEDVQRNEESTPKHYTTQPATTYSKPSAPEYPRYYSSRPSAREEYRHNHISELPHPNPLILKSPPPHLAHIPKALPMYRPLTKPVYSAGGYVPSALTQRPYEAYSAPPFKRRPTSLLDSYIPSGVQVEYMKRGYTNDPLVAYEALSSGRHFPQPTAGPRHFERGFLPNQMYHTAGGAITYGHYKRTPKVDKVQRNDNA